MPKSQNKLTRFWQELKRRKVFGVVATYAASAYIVIEVINNLVGPLHLPEWVPTIVVLLLIAGLPIAVVLAWIFDFTPQGIRKTESFEELEKKEIPIQPLKRKLKLSYVLNAILIIAVIVLAYREIFKRDTLERLRSSGERIAVAVMPFQNMTNDTTWNIWQDGIQDRLVSYLSDFSDQLLVRPTQTTNIILKSYVQVNYAAITPSIASSVSKKLDADIFIYGNLKKPGNKVLLTAELIDSKTAEVLKSFEIEGLVKDEEILHITDSLRRSITDFLILSKLISESNRSLQSYKYSGSPAAYRYFVLGNQAVYKGDTKQAIDLYSQAYKIDSNFITAGVFIARNYENLDRYDSAKKWCINMYRGKDQIQNQQQKILINWLYSRYYETPKEAIGFLQQLEYFNDQSPDLYAHIGEAYIALQQYKNAIPACEKVLKIYKKWKLKPLMSGEYTQLGYVYHKTGQYKKEKKLYKKGESDFGDVAFLRFRQAVLELTEGDTVTANKYIEKYIALMKENSSPESVILTNLGNVYNEAGILDKAEEYYRQALSLEPENPTRMNNLAWFLIDKDRNINEGMRLVGKALEFNPANFTFLDTKGWGLYKQGKYKEALEILQKSWDLRREKAEYYHESFLHLEAAKKAVAGQK
jgi:tetratricopeptide (TPR) repeat protein